MEKDFFSIKLSSKEKAFYSYSLQIHSHHTLIFSWPASELYLISLVSLQRFPKTKLMFYYLHLFGVGFTL